MVVLEAKIAGKKTVFETGEFEVTSVTVKKPVASKPPVELYVVSPVSKGTYPVLLFCHGFMLNNNCYTELLQHIASHGYIIVAPKLYGLIPVSNPKEVKIAAQVAQWISSLSGLSTILPEKINCDLENLALSGHSRGGKTAFALALGKIDNKVSCKCFEFGFRNLLVRSETPTADIPKFKALIGIDPVGGNSPSNQGAPNILEYIPRCFNMSIPVAVIGTGYANQPHGITPAPGPDGVNHSEFFNESKPPACYFLTKDYGHVDMLDEWMAKTMSLICKSGKGSRDLMRKSVGGIVVAFLKAYLGGGNEEDLNAIVKDPSLAPITLDPVIYVKE